MTSTENESFLDRFAGVVTLKRPTYEVLQRDPAASLQALLIVVFLGLANGIALVTTPLAIVSPDTSAEMAAALESLSAALTFETTDQQIMALAVGVVGAIISWYISSWLLCVIGNRFAGGNRAKVSATEMRRLVGWGYSPSLASFLAPIPIAGPLLALAGTLWAFVTGIMALRAAFDIGVWKAIAIEVAVFLVIVLVVLILAVVTVMFTVAFG